MPPISERLDIEQKHRNAERDHPKPQDRQKPQDAPAHQCEPGDPAETRWNPVPDADQKPFDLLFQASIGSGQASHGFSRACPQSVLAIQPLHHR